MRGRDTTDLVHDMTAVDNREDDDVTSYWRRPGDMSLCEGHWSTTEVWGGQQSGLHWSGLVTPHYTQATHITVHIQQSIMTLVLFC